MSINDIGSLCFGLMIGWITHRTLRRKTGSGLSDIAGVIGAVSGGAVTALFKDSSFSLYCIGLAVGFFLYFIIALLLSRGGKGEAVDKWMGD